MHEMSTVPEPVSFCVIMVYIIKELPWSFFLLCNAQFLLLKLSLFCKYSLVHLSNCCSTLIPW